MINLKSLVLLKLLIIVFETAFAFLFYYFLWLRIAKFCFITDQCGKKTLKNLIVSVATELILKFSEILFDIIMLVSSANNIGLANLFMVNERPFM
jgi:hypothetical protein